MRRLSLCLVLVATPLFAAPSTVVRGRVTLAGDGVPGVEVTLAGRTRFTDERGRYSFESVPPGLRVVKAELEGLGLVETVIEVKDGDNRIADVVLPWADPPPAVRCGEDEPESIWDRETCADHDLDTALIEAVARGDRSAVALLGTRYATAPTYSQRLRIAGAILGRFADDRTMWEEVERHADIAVRILGESRERFEAYCDGQGYPARRYEDVVWSALVAALRDPRARPVLLRALESSDSMIVHAAIVGFAMQKDESALPAIERALRRFPGSTDLPPALREFATPAADALALKFEEPSS